MLEHKTLNLFRWGATDRSPPCGTRLMNINTFWYSHRHRWLIASCVFISHTSVCPPLFQSHQYFEAGPEASRERWRCTGHVTLWDHGYAEMLDRENKWANSEDIRSQIRKQWVCWQCWFEEATIKKLFCRLPSPTYNSLLYIEEILNTKLSAEIERNSRKKQFQSISIRNAVKSISD